MVTNFQNDIIICFDCRLHVAATHKNHKTTFYSVHIGILKTNTDVTIHFINLNITTTIAKIITPH